MHPFGCGTHLEIISFAISAESLDFRFIWYLGAVLVGGAVGYGIGRAVAK
jgi:hypothetical protein